MLASEVHRVERNAAVPTRLSGLRIAVGSQELVQLLRRATTSREPILAARAAHSHEQRKSVLDGVKLPAIVLLTDNNREARDDLAGYGYGENTLETPLG